MNTSRRWFVRTLDVRTDGGIPDGDAWLSQAEREECARWRDPLRRRDWRAGRCLLKSMVRAELIAQNTVVSPLPWSDIEVLSRDALGRGVRPRACVSGRWLPWQLSLAHCDGIVCAMLAPAMNVRVGIDVVRADAPLSEACDLWFTPGEQRAMQSLPQVSAPALWAAKEAIYKGTNCGESFVPALIEVEPQSESRLRWSCRGRPSSGADTLHVSYRGDWIIALAALHADASEGRL